MYGILYSAHLHFILFSLYIEGGAAVHLHENSTAVSL